MLRFAGGNAKMSTDVVVLNLGFPGPIGPPGLGAPPGGAPLTVLQKIDATDYNTQWAALPTVARGSAVLDFGAWPGSNNAQVSVTGQTLINANSSIVVSVQYVAQGTNTASDVQFYDGLMEVIASTPIPGSGFTVYGYSNEKIQGQILVTWTWV
jgi:hypothetical protein